jgi:Peptidase A4 family
MSRSKSILYLIAATVAAVLVLGALAATSAQASPRPQTPGGARITERHSGQVVQVPATAIPGTHLPVHLVLNPARKSGTAVSGNWSGYADVTCGTCKLRYIEANFTTPSINCSNAGMTSNTFYVSDWVGLDGFNSETVEQTGTTGVCEDGAPVYFAWYEMYPLLPVVFEFESQPGDNITADVYWDQTPNVYRLTLMDTTEGIGFQSPNLTCPSGSACINSSSEVITEDPGGAVPAGIYLANYGRVNFTQASVTMRNGVQGNLLTSAPPYYSPYAVTMANPLNGDIMSVPSGLVNGTGDTGRPVSDFYDTWQASF